MEVLSWTKPHTMYFIELLKQYPCLWRKKSKNFKNKRARSDALTSMGLKLSAKMRCVVTNVDITKKLHTLKTQYQREKKAVQKESRESGAGSGEVYKPKLWCFNELDFFDSDIIPVSSFNLDDVEPPDHVILCMNSTMGC